MKRKIPQLIWTILLAAGIVFCIAVPVGTCLLEWQGTDVYEGKVAFWSEEEYVEFKKVMAPTQVQIVELDILSSEPPIIIQFKVEVDKDFEFSYGKKEEVVIPGWALPVGLSLLGFAIIAERLKLVEED